LGNLLAPEKAGFTEANTAGKILEARDLAAFFISFPAAASWPILRNYHFKIFALGG